MGTPLTDQELHNLAMNLVGHELEAAGFEFMAINSKMGKIPQFVCVKERQLYFIAVCYVSYPKDPLCYDSDLTKKIAAHAESFNAKTMYAGVGISNAQDRRLPVYLNEPYIVDYHGLVEI